MGRFRGRRDARTQARAVELIDALARAWEAGDRQACEPLAHAFNELDVWRLPAGSLPVDAVVRGATVLAAYAVWAFDAMAEDREDAPEHLTGIQSSEDAWHLLDLLPDETLTSSDDLLDPDDPDLPVRRPASPETDAAIAALTAHEIWVGTFERAITKDLIRAIRLPAGTDQARAFQALARAEHERRRTLPPEAEASHRPRPAGLRQALADIGRDLWHGT